MKLNAAQIACLASGGTQEQVAALATAPEANPPGNPGADATAAPGAADAGAVAASSAAATGAVTATTPPAGEAGASAAAAAGTVTAEDAGSSVLVSHLKAEVSDLTTKLLASQVEAAGFKAQAGLADSLTETLRAVVGEKLVALGGTADIAAGYTSANIVDEFKRIDGIHKKQFRVGGVAAVASPEEKPNTKATVNPMFAAAVENSLVK
jgi:hypothetical protein